MGVWDSARRRIALVVVVAVAVLAGSTGRAANARPTDTGVITGVATDGFGRPLAGVVISDGDEGVLTDAAGHYRMDVGLGTYTLRASRADLSSSTKTVTMTVPGTRVVDFPMLYMTYGRLQPSAVRSGTSMTVQVFTTAPDPGAAGQVDRSCVVATDGRLATFVGVTDGWQRWDLLVEAGGAGEQEVEFVAARCNDGAALSDGSLVRYVVDDEAPQVGDPRPQPFAPSAAVVSVAVRDRGSWIEAARSGFAVDGVPLTTPTFDGTRLAAPAGDLSEGEHTVIARVADGAGNMSALTFDFVVDHQAPAATATEPTGRISDTTPMLRVAATDVGSGVDPAGIALFLADGLRSARLAATFDPDTSVVSYQVPDVPTGVQLGEGPLLDGDYVVILVMFDRAGNEAVVSWAFSIATVTSALP